MLDYLERFLKQTRIKADKELVSRWHFDASFYGDKNIKVQMATARRTASMLEKTLKNFSNLHPDQDRAIQTAVKVTRQLASDLESLAIWASAYKKFCDTEREKERIAEFERVADQRWGNDWAALNFEKGVIQDITTTQGRLAFGRWMHLSGGVDLKRFSIECIYDPFISRSNFRDGANLRHEMAEIIQSGKSGSMKRHVSFNGEHLHASWADYEAYLVYRKQVAQTTAQIVKTINPGTV